jgi:hypothetical protein
MMANDSSKKFFADMTVGFKKDQEIKTEIVLYKYGKVYFPNNDYYNSDPMPIEWLELIEDHKVLQEMFDSDKEFTSMQEKLIKEQQKTDPNWIAMSTSRHGSIALKQSQINDDSYFVGRPSAEESPLCMTSYRSEEDTKFVQNPNRIMSPQDRD